mgnify:CR=1 FL=1
MILKNKLSNKKAQLGLTLTWFVAFLVIVTIIVIYVVSVVMISANKKVSSSQLSLDVNSMNLKSLESERKIEYLLNAPVTTDEGKDIQIKDLIELWGANEDTYDDLLKISVRDVLDSLEYDFYNEDTSRWEINVNSLVVLKKTSPEKVISIDSTKYGFMAVGGVTSQKSYFSLSTGEAVEVILTTGNTPWGWYN